MVGLNAKGGMVYITEIPLYYVVHSTLVGYSEWRISIMFTNRELLQIDFETQEEQEEAAKVLAFFVGREA